jgi:putative autotransporter adhesin-like protein
MKTKLLSTLTIIAFLFSSFIVNAENVKEERTVSTFSGVDLRIAGEVFITQEATQKVVIEGDADDIKDLKTEVSGGTLVIKFEGWNIRYGNIKIYISVAKFDNLEVSGSGSIVAQSKITSGDMEMDVSGSGKIKIDSFEAKDLEAEISGSGKISLGGPGGADQMEFDISGSGDIYAEDFVAKEIEGDISGSGKAYVNCTEFLEVDISGSGKVYYKGKPRIDADISGSGSVKQN